MKRESGPPQRPCSRGHRRQWQQSAQHGGGWLCTGCHAAPRDLGLDFTDALGGFLDAETFLQRFSRGKG